MTEIRFYHLRTRTLEQALPEILTKVVSQGRRAVVKTQDVPSAERLNDCLWTWRPDSFLPHDELLENFSFVVLQRESKPEDVAKEEEFKRTYAHLRRDSAAEAIEKGGWYVMNNDIIPGRSTDFRDAIKAGVHFSDPADQVVSDYAWEHLRDLYGLVLPDDRPKPQLPGLGPA